MKGLRIGFIRRKRVRNEEEGREGVTEEVKEGPEEKDEVQEEANGGIRKGVRNREERFVRGMGRSKKG